MGKRSSFTRRPQDAYDTPQGAVMPLLPFLEYGTQFVEPCAGAGDLVRHLEAQGMSCLDASDIEPRWEDARQCDALSDSFWVDNSADYIITNPPWSRQILHPMIEGFSDLRPTWLLFDADWMHTKQSAPFMPRLRKVVSVGRVKWIPDSTSTGKDNCAWYLFDKPDHASAPNFIGRAA